jgi:ATP-dependent RNA helicase RhlE
MSDFSSLNLHPAILKTLVEKGYLEPTPIQAKAIPSILNGQDVLGVAQTGTGKTAAFSLPLLSNLATNKVKPAANSTRALILTPTRELASQIGESINVYGRGLQLRHAVILGGVRMNSQVSAISHGVDIIIATPGRLLDLTNQGYVKYHQLETLVLDEADRMLDMGFAEDLKKIIAKLPANKQTIFFSATMPRAIENLANDILKDPVRIEIHAESSTSDRIQQVMKFVDKSDKLALLESILRREEVKSALVFTKTKHCANRVVEFLDSISIRAAAIHGNKTQQAREKALLLFRAGKVKVLVATDIAARGIDVPGVTHVINYDLPEDAESYVHRIGRTGRAGLLGTAISFCDKDQYAALRDIERIIKFEIPVNDTHQYHDSTPRVIKKKERYGGRSGGNFGGGGYRSSSNSSGGNRNFGGRSNSQSGNFAPRNKRGDYN